MKTTSDPPAIPAEESTQDPIRITSSPNESRTGALEPRASASLREDATSTEIPFSPASMRQWAITTLADLGRSTPEKAIELKKAVADDYFAFPDYAKALDELDPELSREIKPLVDLAQVADFYTKNMHRSPDSMVGIVKNAPAALKNLLSDEVRMRELDGPLAARLQWIDLLQLQRFGAHVAAGLGRADAAERYQSATDLHEQRLRSHPEKDPFHPVRLAREARLVADFIASNHGLFHWKITDNIGKTGDELYEVLGNASRMQTLDPLVTGYLAGVPELRVSEVQAVIANALKRIDAGERSAAANAARAAANLPDRTFDPWGEVDSVIDFVASNYRLPPQAIFQNLAAASPELRAIFTDRAHLESIEQHINQQLPNSAAVGIANFHEIVAIALDRGDAPERAAAAATAREIEARQIQIDKQHTENVAVSSDNARPKSVRDEESHRNMAESAEHRLAQHQANQIIRFVLPNSRKPDGELAAAVSQAAPEVQSLLRNPSRMEELFEILSRQGGIDPVDLKRVQHLAQGGGATGPAPAPAPTQAEGKAKGPAGTWELVDERPAPPPARKNGNGFRPRALVSDQPALPTTGILERITYKTQRDGSVLYSLDDHPAFVDHGDQILMAGNADKNEEAIVAALLVAKEKYRGAFELTGDIEFKRRTIEIMIKYKIDSMLNSPEQEAMRREISAAMKNDPVQAASPGKPVQPVDLTRIVINPDAANRSSATSHSAEETSSATPGPEPSVVPVDAAREYRRDQAAQSPPPSHSEPVNRLAGTVLSHGEAHFEYDPDENMSYFVKLENADGQTRTIWGVDLKRLANDHALTAGDSVVLQNLGRKPVHVFQIVKDEDGKQKGFEQVLTHRNEWAVEFKNRAIPAEGTLSNKQASKPSNAPFSFIDASKWWDTQHAIVQNFQIDYAEMQADLSRIGARPTEGQAYWLAAGNSAKPPPDSKTVLEQHMANAQETLGPSAPMLVLHALKTLPNGSHQPSLLLFKGGDENYLQGFIHIGDQKQPVIAHLPNKDAHGMEPVIQLSAMTLTPDGPTWRAIGQGIAINRSDHGEPVHFDEVNFKLGTSTLIARTTNLLDHSIRQKLGFERPRRERSKDEGAVAPPTAEPRKSTVERAKAAPGTPKTSKPRRPRSMSKAG